MNELAALTCLKLTAEKTNALLRDLLGQPLRRAGTFGKLCVAGAMTCAGQEKDPTTAMIWSSAYGARKEIHAVLHDLSQGAEPMPFDFIATLPIVPAIHAAQQMPCIKFGVFMPAMADAVETWPRLLQMALCWLEENRCERVICGWVEEERGPQESPEHTSHWLAITRPGLSKIPLARIDLASTGDICNSEYSLNMAPGNGFIPALQNWLQNNQENAIRPEARQNHPKKSPSIILAGGVMLSPCTAG